MNVSQHFRVTGGALKNWFVAQLQDALAVAALWLIGMFILRVPLWYVWTPMAFVFQFIPHFGPVLTLLGPAISALIQGGFGKMLFVLILYAIVVVIDGLVFQPMIMRRTAKVPVWASVIVPLAMGLSLGFWGVLLAPPLLAVFYAYWNRRKAARQLENTNVSTQ